MLCGLGAVPTNFNIGGDIFINEWLDFDAIQRCWCDASTWILLSKIAWTLIIELCKRLFQALFEWWYWMSLIMPLCFWMINMNIIDCSPCEHWSIHIIPSTVLWTLLSVFTIFFQRISHAKKKILPPAFIFWLHCNIIHGALIISWYILCGSSSVSSISKQQMIS